MSSIKVCPHCGSREFMAHIKRGCIVESDGIDENGNPTFKVIREGAKNRYELEILRCSSCKHDLTEADLVGGATCKNCGKTVSPSNLDENGNCEVCAMLLANPQLQNASQDELLRLLARAMKGMKSDTNIVAQKQEQTAKLEENLEVEEDNTGSAADAILNGNVPSDVQEPKTRRGRKRTVRRATDNSVEAETPQESPVEPFNPLIPNEQTMAVNAVAQVQEAPFPDIAGMPDIPQQQAEQPMEMSSMQVGSGFQMFDSGDDEEPF